MADYTVSASVDAMMRAVNASGIRSATGTTTAIATAVSDHNSGVQHGTTTAEQNAISSNTSFRTGPHAPTNSEKNVNANWNSVSGDSEILNKPTLGSAAVADTEDFAPAINNVAGNGTVLQVVKLTQIEYDALTPPVGTTLYIIVD